MADPSRVEAIRAELDQLGARHFLDVRATARRMLERMPPVERTAFAAAAADRILREDERLPDRERPAYLADWRPTLDAVWRVLAGEAAALRQVATAIARCYLSPAFHTRRHDDPADAADHAVMASLYAAECALHGCVEFAAWAGWRSFDAAALQAAADPVWPHRRPTGVSLYAWELAHPAVQAELDQQLADLELLGVDGPALGDTPGQRQGLLVRLRTGDTAVPVET